MLETRTAWLERTSGARYVLLVPPNAHSVHPEDLPEDVQSAPVRPVHQLLTHLAETGSFARVLYPLDALVAAKGDELPVYPKTDTHWSYFAQYLAYRRLMEELGESPVIERSAVRFDTAMQVGDLGYKVHPHEESLHVWGRVPEPRAHVTLDNGVHNTGSMIVTECEEGIAGTCMVLGDSYSYGMLPLFAATFRRMVFAHTPSLDFALAEEEAPRIVVSVLNERFLINPPSDMMVPTTREMADAKLAAGDTRPPSRAWEG